MQSIVVNFQINTPALCGGATPDAEAELQISGFLGMLRFWWRALYVSYYKENLKGREKKLFGSSADENDKDSGQGAFVAFFEDPPLTSDKTIALLLAEMFPISSLKKKKAIPEKKEFKINFLFRSDAENIEENIEEIKEALKVMGLLGGIGFAWRRGFGSLELKKLEDEALKITQYVAYKEKIEEIISKSCKIMNGNKIPLIDGNTIIYIKEYDLPPIDAHKAFIEELSAWKKKPLNVQKFKSPDILDFFSDQAERNKKIKSENNKKKSGEKREPLERIPSPYAVHIHEIEDEYSVIAVTRFKSESVFQSRDRVTQFLLDNSFEEIKRGALE